MLIAFLFLCIASFSAHANLFNQSLTPVDRDVPEFSLLNMHGEPVTPKTLAGKTWLINFWAVWCAPCLDELPALNNMWAQLEEQDVGMLAINIGQQPDEIEAFLAKHNLSIDFPIVISDPVKTLGNWEGRSLPYTVVVNSLGKVVYEAVGPREWDEPEFVNTVLEVKASTPVSLIERVKTKLGAFSWLGLIAMALILVVRQKARTKTHA